MNFTAPSLRVVIVEDEPLIRMLLAETLEEAGFAVIEAERADEALDLLSTKAEEINVMVTDIHMPGPMTGIDLARYAREHWPWITVVVASGRAVPAPGELPKDTRFLLKPYALGDVVTTIQELVSQR
jgi:CheY-like chemotaxis protein